MNLARGIPSLIDSAAKRFGYRLFPAWAVHPSQINEIDSPGQVDAIPVSGGGTECLMGSLRLRMPDQGKRLLRPLVTR